MRRFRNFTPGQPFVAEPPRPANETIDTARALAYAAGHKDGLAEARAEQEGAVITALATLATDIRAALTLTQEMRSALSLHAAELALLVGEALAGIAREQVPLAGIERMVRDLIASRIDTPVLTISVAPALVEAVEALVEACGSERPSDCSIVVLPEAGLPRGDCRVEWIGGNASLSAADRQATIEAIFQTFRVAQPTKGSK